MTCYNNNNIIIVVIYELCRDRKTKKWLRSYAGKKLKSHPVVQQLNQNDDDIGLKKSKCLQKIVKRIQKD